MIDLGPSGYFDQEKVLLVSALGLLRAKGIKSETLEEIVRQVVFALIRYIWTNRRAEEDPPLRMPLNSSQLTLATVSSSISTLVKPASIY